jgi:hypothetical protein
VVGIHISFLRATQSFGEGGLISLHIFAIGYSFIIVFVAWGSRGIRAPFGYGRVEIRWIEFYWQEGSLEQISEWEFIFKVASTTFN